MTIEDCRFSSNRAHSSLGGFGGAVGVTGLDSVVIRRTEFADNSADDYGGHLYVYSAQTALLDECSFLEGATAGVAGQLAFIDARTVGITNCKFQSHSPSTSGVSGVRVDAWTLRVDGCHVLDRGAPHATRWAIATPSPPGASPAYDVSNSTFVAAAGNYYGAVSIESDWNAIAVTHSTFRNVTLRIFTIGTNPVVVSNTIVAGAPTLVESSGAPAVFCNVFWPDAPDVHAPDQTQVAHNRTADPLFCSDAGGDESVRDGGPCVASPDGCGLIGAVGIGCAQTAVSNTTWGRIKAQFRESR
ncbi:MAG: hypothetical protein U0527_03510 [Candidatus Eisenbacteria bacterium]